jgi:hypothetical protein
MRFRKETEQPVHELPCSQITEGAAGFAKISRSNPSFDAKIADAADTPQYRKNSLLVIATLARESFDNQNTEPK